MDIESSHFPHKMSTARPQKRRPVTYGKAKRDNSSVFSNWDASPEKPKPTVKRLSPDSTKPVSKFEPQKPSGKLARPSSKRPREDDADVFDVPLSEDDHVTSHKPKRSVKSPSPISNRHKTAKSLAPSSTFASSNAAELRKRKDEAIIEGSRPQVEAGIHSKNVERTTAQGKAKLAPSVEISTSKSAGSKSPEKRPTVKALKPHKESPSKTSAVARQKLPIGPLKGVSSPARLEVMVSKPRATSKHKTPSPARDLLSPSKKMKFDSDSSPHTPPTQSSPSPARIIRSGATTPRQTELWGRLNALSDDSDTPSRLSVENLRISSLQKPASTRSLLRSVSDVAQPIQSRRGRLIDTLADSQPLTEEDEDMDDDDMTEDETAESSGLQAAIPEPMEIDPPAAPVSQGPVKVTYGTLKRTYLEDSNIEAALFGDSFDDSIKPSGSGLANPRSAAQSQFDLPEDDEDLDDSQTAMKSVHFLRAAGGNQRFKDDFENTLQDIQSRTGGSMSQARSGLLDLCEKLTDKKFVGRMTDQGLEQRLLQACSGVKDTIFRFALAAAIALIADGDAPRAALRNVQASDCFQTLFDMFAEERDIVLVAKERRLNMSKVAQSSLAEFTAMILGLPFWGDQKPLTLSPHLIALKATELLVRSLRGKGFMDELLDEQKTARLLDIMERSLDTVTGDSLISLEIVISTLECGSIIPGRNQTSWTPKRRSRLAVALPRIFTLKSSSVDDLSFLSLRLMLNLTNNNAKSSEQFAQPDLIRLLVSSIIERFALLTTAGEQSEEELAKQLDRLILSLGAIINLAEHCDTARTPVLADGAALLDQLVDSFMNGRERAAHADSVQATQSNVAYGWLAVALGNLCQNDEVCRAVARRLTGGSITPLVEAIEEFIVYNHQVDRKTYEEEQDDSVIEGFTQRLKSVVAKLKGENSEGLV